LRELARHNKVIAIGEIGLDYYRDRAARDVQQQVLCEQLALAAELGKPVIIHNREASEDVLDILMGWHTALVASGSTLAERPGVLHSFNGRLEFAKQAMALNFYLGISGPVTFQNARELQAIVAALPLDKILIEQIHLSDIHHEGQRE
jgi:TatD DNase family protein